MNGDEFGIRDHLDEVVAGQCALVSALVVALDENGLLPRDRYCDILQRLWIDMPEEHALGAGGEMIERVIERLGLPAVADPPIQPASGGMPPVNPPSPANDDPAGAAVRRK